MKFTQGERAETIWNHGVLSKISTTEAPPAPCAAKCSAVESFPILALVGRSKNENRYIVILDSYLYKHLMEYKAKRCDNLICDSLNHTNDIKVSRNKW